MCDGVHPDLCHPLLLEALILQKVSSEPPWPTATIRDYRESRDQNPDELSQMYPMFAVRVPLGSAPCRGCRVLARRLDLRGRLSDADLGEILRGNVFKTLFLEDLLVESSFVAGVQH